MTSESGRFLSFDPVAAEYDRTRFIPEWVPEYVARVCAREANLSTPGQFFLDAGVGTGRFTAPLSKIAPGQVVGLDVSRTMLEHAQQKSAPNRPLLLEGDLQRLPLRSGAFSGALLVHVLHVIEGWRSVLDQVRRALVPQSGVLLIGGEQGQHSSVIDFYYEQARARGVLGHSLGTPGFSQALSHLKRDPRASVRMLGLPHLKWKRTANIGETLAALSQRTYSLMWNIPDNAHARLIEETTLHAQRTIGPLSASETLESQFVMYTVRWQ